MDEGLLKPNTGTTSICYYFFKEDDSSRQDSTNAICAILHQLFVQKPLLLQYATRSFKHHGKYLRTMFSELWGILEQSAADPAAGEIVCVLDALDECREEARKELIQTLTDFYSSRHHRARRNLKFLATSRPYADIERAFHHGIKDMTSIRLRGEDESKQISKEIDLVIDIRVPHICGAREPPFELEVQQALISGLKRFKNRIYLWLYLTLDVIEDTLESTIYNLEKLINRLPQRIEDAYEGILKRISTSGNVEDARSLLHIVVAALRPLTLGEIQIALAVNKKLEHGERCESYNDLVLQSEDAFRVKLRNLCGLFLSIVDAKVHLIHQTAKEFLLSKSSNDRSTSLPKSMSEVWRHSLAPVESNLILLKICLCYLLLCGTEGKSISLRYAARWIDHFQSARSGFDESILQSTLNICEPRSPSFSKWWPEVSSEVYAIHSNLQDLRFRIENTDSWTSLMVVSLIGLETVAKFSLEKTSARPNIQDENGQTALHFALEHRHLDIAKMLVEENDVALNIPDNHGYTPLHSAAESGQLEFVKVFIKANGVAPNLQNKEGNTALHLAAVGDRLEVVKLLIKDNRVELNIQDQRGGTPLYLAAQQGHLEVVKVLVEKEGVEPDLKDQHGRTLLYMAAKYGYTETVKRLLEEQSYSLHRKDIDDKRGQTPLHLAAQRGHSRLFRLLIEKQGLEPNLKNQHGRTLLHMAAENGYTDTVIVLLEKPFPLFFEDRDDKSGQTPLHMAAQNGYAETVQVLAAKHFFMLYDKDYFGRTPLHLAAQHGSHGHIETVKLLVEKQGFELNLKDSLGQTPLHIAAEHGHIEIIEMLVEKQGIELNVQDRYGRTPLLSAARGGYYNVVKMLVEKASHVFDFDPDQGISLEEWARSKGYIEPPHGRKRRRGE